METYLDTLIVKAQASLDTSVERLTRFTRQVDITSILALHVSLLMVQGSVNNTIPDSLGDNIFSRLFTVQAKTKADVSERYPRVCD